MGMLALIETWWIRGQGQHQVRGAAVGQGLPFQSPPAERRRRVGQVRDEGQDLRVSFFPQ